MRAIRLLVHAFSLCLLVASVVFGQDPPRLRGVMLSPAVEESDLHYLGQNWGVNVVRWQLNWEKKADGASVQEYDAWLEASLQRLDRLLPVCQKYGIKVLIDLHSPPGGRTASGESAFLKDATSQGKFIQVWKKIAARYVENKLVWGYDLANEPAQLEVPAGVLDWHRVATVTAQEIRKIDTTHTIVVEPLLWGKAKGFADFAPLPSTISNVEYSFHMYYPNELTHQNVSAQYPAAVRYPGIVEKKMWDKNQLRLSMQPAIDFQKKYNVRMFVGEFSAVRWAAAGSAYAYLKDVIDIFESNGWDWTYHAFREWHGWSVEHTEDKNNVNRAMKQTNREKLLRYWFSKNSRI